jgi:hypothetical protein
MRWIAIGLLAGAGLLVGSSAFAADVIVTNEAAPLLQQARVVCDAYGQCWRTAPQRVIIDNGYGYGYYPRRYYDDRYNYDDTPAVGVYGPGVRFGFGFGPRPYW